MIPKCFELVAVITTADEAQVRRLRGLVLHFDALLYNIGLLVLLAIIIRSFIIFLIAKHVVLLLIFIIMNSLHVLWLSFVVVIYKLFF